MKNTSEANKYQVTLNVLYFDLSNQFLILLQSNSSNLEPKRLFNTKQLLLLEKYEAKMCMNLVCPQVYLVG